MAKRDNLLKTLEAPISKTTQELRSDHRVLLKLAIDGDLRFISHRDTMRMLSRAIIRADLPAAYTRGFNPHIKLSLPLPRSVGMATDDDPVVVVLSTDCSPAQISAGLAPQLPVGARLGDVIALPVGSKLRLISAAYQVGLTSNLLSRLPQAIEEFISSDTAVVAPYDEYGDPRGKPDIRPFITELSLVNEQLRFVTVFHDGRTVSPKVLMPALGLPWDQIRHRIRRTTTTMSQPGSCTADGIT